MSEIRQFSETPETFNMDLLLKQICKLEIISKMHYLLLSKFQNLSNIFCAFDRNDDDYIDEFELKKGFLIFCNYKNDENIKLFLTYFDKDQDGKISANEWEYSTFYISEDIKTSKIDFFRSQILDKKSINESFFDYIAYYLDQKNPIVPKDDQILKKSFSKSDFNYLMNHNDSNQYFKKSNLLKFDPYFLNRKPENSVNFDEVIEKSGIFSKNYGKNNLHEKDSSGQKTGKLLDNTSDDGSGSELSFEKVCDVAKEEPVSKHLLSSEKRIKEKFSANDSFYKDMITDLNSNKLETLKEDFENNELPLKEPDQVSNFMFKLQEVSNDKNGSVLKVNNSFLENIPQRISSLKRQSESKEKVARNFDSFDILNDLNKKLMEKEKEIGFAINALPKKLEKITPIQISPKKNKTNEILAKNATEKVQKMFQNFKQGLSNTNVKEVSNSKGNNSEHQNNMIFLENFSQGKNNNSIYDKSKSQLEETEKSKILYNYASPKNTGLLLNNRKKNTFLNHESIKKKFGCEDKFSKIMNSSLPLRKK